MRLINVGNRKNGTASISKKTIRKHWLLGSVLTAKALCGVKVVDGAYIAAEFNRFLADHTFVIHVVGGHKMV